MAAREAPGATPELASSTFTTNVPGLAPELCTSTTLTLQELLRYYSTVGHRWPEATDAESEADVEDPQQGDEMPLEEGYYVYTRVVGTERTADGELRAWVEWESTLEPLSALYPDDARALAIYLRRPQTMPTEPPPYHYDGIRGMVYTDEGDLRVWMNWPNTLEPISSLTAADERKLSVPTNKSLHPTP
ncbi:hypothetical protein PR003_g16350 [Phytophthora rubi]|uniref:Uncharacterized protein n=1 Tax=Phytophthora rubi TaxID=129364 RepID=A0A6A4ER92_9STRA|nr:hypothetical protein PR003_g16350 [Phytophthora rubi]